MKQKKAPVRMCIGCHENKPKKELLRIVKVAQKLLDEGKMEDSICLDTTGKIAGRGAYICSNIDCLKAARKSRKLEREFETAIDDALYESLMKKMEGISGSSQ